MQYSKTDTQVLRMFVFQQHKRITNLKKLKIIDILDKTIIGTKIKLHIKKAHTYVHNKTFTVKIKSYDTNIVFRYYFVCFEIILITYVTFIRLSKKWIENSLYALKRKRSNETQ